MIRDNRKARLAGPLLVLAGWVMVSGCGLSLGGLPSGADRAMPFGYYPSVARVQHPDSVSHSEYSFEELERVWSAGSSDIRGGRRYRTMRHGTFATLWSKEVAMAWVGYRAKRENLSEAIALELADETADMYVSVVKIVLHVFVDERYADAYQATDFSYPATTIELVDDKGNRYRPARIETGRGEIVRFTPDQPGALYRENALYFSRRVNGKDILEDVNRLRVAVSNTPAFRSHMLFTWDFGNEGGRASRD